MEMLILKMFEIFSLEYMFSVILMSYFAIKTIDALNGERVVPTWAKRTITCVAGVILFGIFIKYTDTNLKCLTASFFAAVFAYDSVVKELLRKLNMDYRK